jgi:hypothetical protein
MRILMGVVLAASLAAQNRPDFSGVWHLNRQKSQVEIQTAWAKVELTSSTFSVNLRTFNENCAEESFDWRFTIGPGESSNTMHGAPMKSHVAWDGDALVVQSVTMFGSDALKTLDRWTLAESGKTLTFREQHQNGDEPEGTSVFVFERRPTSAWPEAPSKPAEEAYKNIQILKSIPAERLPVVMGLFARSLGVSCDHCHVAGDFTSDKKPAKQTARRMYEMVTAANRDSFGGSELVSCWTCHRGAVEPELGPPTSSQ